MPGNSVKISKIIEQTFRRIDDHPSSSKIDIEDDFSNRRNQYFARGVGNHINVITAGLDHSPENPDFFPCNRFCTQPDELVVIIFPFCGRRQAFFRDKNLLINDSLRGINVGNFGK